MMRLAVVARALGERPSGRGVYVREILKRLPELGWFERIVVYAGAPVAIQGVDVRAARGRGPLGDLGRWFRGIGAEIQREPVDVLWCSTHLVPRGLPVRMPIVVSLLDVVFRDHPATMSVGRRLLAPIQARSLEQARRIVCISNFTRERLRHHWPHLEARARVVPLAPMPRAEHPATCAPQLPAVVPTEPWI